MTYRFNGKRIWVAGHNGLVGSAINRRLASENCEIVTVSRDKVDLTRQSDVETWMAETKPNAIFLAAAKVGGIKANNDFPAEFIRDNLAIQTNIIHAAYLNKVEKLLFLGSSCIYPKDAPQPIKEESLLTNTLESSNAPYALAKIAGIEMCKSYRRQYDCDFISVMPTNLYGIGDNYDLESAHVPAALIRRLHEAKQQNAPEIAIWGTGTPLREFMSADDLADACIFLMKNYSAPEHINIGSGHEHSIQDLARIIANIIGYKGKIKTDPTQPDGAMRKLLDCTKLNAMGWRAKTPLTDGLTQCYIDFMKNNQ